MSTIATSGRWARTLRRSSSPSPAWAATSKPACSSTRTAAARRSAESSAITTRMRSATAAIGIRIEVQDKLDGGLHAGLVERLADRGALECDAEDRRPEPARLRRRAGADLPVAPHEVLDHGPLALDVQPREGVAHRRREVRTAAHEQRR